MTQSRYPGPVVVRAAGTVLWRPIDGEQQAEVAVVHRPGHDDWSLPKGKLDPGETMPACAVRETEEETGVRPVLGRLVGDVSYPLAEPTVGRKVVEFFAGRAVGGAFRPNEEVDQLRWLRPKQAAELLTYRTDRAVLKAFTALPATTSTVLLVRHGKAGSRSEWRGDDDLRPLSPAGWEQAKALSALLPLFGADRVHSAPKTRCVQTVEGLAANLGVRPVLEPVFGEEAAERDPRAAVARLLELVEAGGVPAICSQGGAIPRMIGLLAERDRLPLANIPGKKGSVWVLSFTPDRPHRLVAADYLPSPLPIPAVRR